MHPHSVCYRYVHRQPGTGSVSWSMLMLLYTRPVLLFSDIPVLRYVQDRQSYMERYRSYENWYGCYLYNPGHSIPCPILPYPEAAVLDRSLLCHLPYRVSVLIWLHLPDSTLRSVRKPHIFLYLHVQHKQNVTYSVYWITVMYEAHYRYLRYSYRYQRSCSLHRYLWSDVRNRCPQHAVRSQEPLLLWCHDLFLSHGNSLQNRRHRYTSHNHHPQHLHRSLYGKHGRNSVLHRSFLHTLTASKIIFQCRWLRFP